MLSYIQSMKTTMIVRMTRPLVHGITILCIYIILYHLRQYTDGIPSIQLRIPSIDTTEMMWFALASAGIFVWISLIK